MKKSLLIASCALLAVACKNKASENAETPNAKSSDVIDMSAFKDDKTVSVSDLRTFRGCGNGKDFVTHQEIRVGDQQYFLEKRSVGGRTMKTVGRETVTDVSRREIQTNTKILSLEMDRAGELLRNPIEYNSDCRQARCEVVGGVAAVSRAYDEGFNEVGRREIQTVVSAPNCRLQSQSASKSVRYGMYTLKNGAQIRAALETSTELGQILCGNKVAGSGSREIIKVRTTEVLPLNTRDICEGTRVVEASRLKLDGGPAIESYQIEITEPEMAD